MSLLIVSRRCLLLILRPLLPLLILLLLCCFVLCIFLFCYLLNPLFLLYCIILLLFIPGLAFSFHEFVFFSYSFLLLLNCSSSSLRVCSASFSCMLLFGFPLSLPIVPGFGPSLRCSFASRFHFLQQRSKTFALPQTRKRVYIVGVHNDVGGQQQIDITFELLCTIFPIAYEARRCDMAGVGTYVNGIAKTQLTYPPTSKDSLVLEFSAAHWRRGGPGCRRGPSLRR